MIHRIVSFRTCRAIPATLSRSTVVRPASSSSISTAAILSQRRHGSINGIISSTAAAATTFSRTSTAVRHMATSATSPTASAKPQNLIEKIVQRYAINLPHEGYKVTQGDFVSISPEHVMTHDNTAAVMSKFKAIGASKVHNPRQPVFTADHDVQNKSEKNLAKYASIQAFGDLHNVDVYPPGRGIGHQIMIEEGYAFPFTMAVASDSHSNMYGGVGCLGTPIVRTDAAAIWATGRTWWQVPPIVKVNLTGKLQKGVSGKDVIVSLCGILNSDQVLNHALEFCGEGVKALTVDDRLTIANMTTEWGALAGVFPVDEVTVAFYQKALDKLKGKSNSRINAERIQSLIENPIKADTGAVYAKEITLDLSTISPYASGPNSVKKATSLAELEAEDIKIHKAYLLSCTNARLSDLNAAAEILKGRKVAPGVEFYVAAASSEVQKDSEAQGSWKVLMDAGAIPLPAGCGPCIGLGVGLLKDGEVGISATNRNFKGRMGSRQALAYLSSPAVVAASAAAGKIISPASFLSGTPARPAVPPTITVHTPPEPSTPSVPTTSPTPTATPDTIPGFPPTHSAELLFCDTDNLDTDGIYPGAYTYQDDLTPPQMAAVSMKNYDPTFRTLVQPSDILVSGFNFGTGSSREQAATCLLYAGVKLIIAGSLSETFKRNAINNGLLCLECPALVRDLREAFQSGEVASRRTGWEATVDFVNGKVSVQMGGAARGVKKEYKISVVGKAAQELVVEGGLEKWVKKRI
ncbi:mitochondrial Homoaconitase [Chytridiales sp. JEL 0842]|nr:mitochondrial Homoaconitase [Chytridiales sp. JEL 0842]